MSHPPLQNQILRRLSPDDFRAIEPCLERVELTLKQDLITPGEPITHVWFPESGMCSVIASARGSEAIEVGLIGLEGMTDHVTKLGDTSVLKSFVQMPGTAFAVGAERYIAWTKRPSVLEVVLRYQQSMIVQVSYTALSHGSFNVEERLARWLCMSFDRSQGADLPLIHEFIAMMLGVRRSGVTTALHILEGHQGIKATRGSIKLRDRAALEDLTQGGYGVPEREYARLMGPFPES
jgi:CRP-like cAMP-binding protein